MPLLDELPEGVLPTDRLDERGVRVYSLTAHALRAATAQRRPGESERAANERWLSECWYGWVRAKLIEHLSGWRCWSAFEAESYGLFRRSSVADLVPDAVLRQVCDLLAQGGENLDVLHWAIAEGRELDPLLALLDRIDINGKRQRLLTRQIRLFVDAR